jgi:trans-2,3-dihydro-3-hydroxyanthranilate isomerase
MRYAFHTLDVFTDRPFGGNQLAVLPHADGLSTEQMQQVAREFNLSETVFVLPPEQARHTRKLRIFTPGVEMPFAGHPTIGAAHLLALLGEIPLGDGEARVVFEEGVGPVPVAVRGRDRAPEFCQLTAARAPEFGPAALSPADAAALLGLAADEVLGGDQAPVGVSAGMPFLFVTLRDRAAVARARLDLVRWQAQLAGWWAPQVFLFARDPELPGSSLRARMFAPALGIVEDPATGAAAAALAGCLVAQERRADGVAAWVVEQGFEMGRPSLLYVEADVRGGAAVRARVGGSSVLMSEGTIDVPSLD